MGLSMVTPLPAPSHAAAAARSPAVAALLSFVWPGLGQLYRGRLLNGLILALPPAALLVVLGGVAAEGLELYAFSLLSPPVALSALGLIVLAGAWRVAAIVGAARDQSRIFGFGSRRRLALSVLLIGSVLVSHAAAALLAWSFYRAGSAIFEELPPDPPSVAAAPAQVTPSPPAAAERPQSEPIVVPPSDGLARPSRPTAPGGGALVIPTDPPPPPVSRPPADQPPAGELPTRINVLLVGLDTGSGGHNTDTLIVASFDTASSSIIMLSLPRDTAVFPLYDGRTYTAKVNSFMSHAARDPGHFPEGGMAALVQQMEFLVGVDIHYYASIDIAGFRRLIELVGGVEVDVEARISDPSYKLGLGRDGFQLEPGRQHLDSWQALAYVRSRKGSVGSDFERARRQQQVLLALRQKVDDPRVLGNLPALLDAASQTIRTNMPVERLPQLLRLLQGSLGADVESIVLGPPTYSELIPKEQIGGLYALQLDMEQLAKLSRRLFGDESRYSR